MIMVREKAANFGGSFASWSFFHSIVLNMLEKIRGKQDYKNNLIATFGTGVFFSARNGIKAGLKNGFTSFCALSVIEGVVLLGQQYQRKKQFLKENELVRMYKAEYERKGIKFIPFMNMTEFDDLEQRNVLKKSVDFEINKQNKI